MSTLIIAEKPSQAREYAEALGVKKKHKGYIELKDNAIIPNAKITWAIGHLVRLKQPNDYHEEVNAWNLDNLPFFPAKMEYEVDPDKIAQFNTIKGLVSKSETIINGTDFGREGSNIFYSILRLCNAQNKEIKRFESGSLVHKDIRKKFKELKDNKQDINMFKEANTRQISDFLIGINLTSLYTNIFREKGINDVFSIGRVQTPTLFMVYQRCKDIENFKEEEFYEIHSDFETESTSIYHGKAKIKTKDKSEIEKLYEDYNLHNEKKGQVKSVETEEKKSKAPKLYALSSLQVKANQLYKYSSKHTLKLAQSLYDKKILSYPRTDTEAITESEFDYLNNMLDDLKSLYQFEFETKYSTPRKPYVVESIPEHHAIIPTTELPDHKTIENLSKDEKNILNMVVKNTLGIFADDYIYDETNIVTSINQLAFFTKGKTDKILGWKSLHEEKNKDNKDENKLPPLEIDSTVRANPEIKTGKTQPPKYLTDGQLITMMMTCGKLVDEKDDQVILKETEGIGTEATRADIINNLIERNYIELKKNRYHITSKGEMLCEAVKGSLLSSPEMTAKWEQMLKKIGLGNANETSFIENAKKFIEKELSLKDEKSKSEIINSFSEKIIEDQIISDCPNCEKGKIIDKRKVFKCNSCEQIFFLNFFKKKLTKSQVKDIIINKRSKKKISLKKKDGSNYSAYLQLKKDEKKAIYIYEVSFK